MAEPVVHPGAYAISANEGPAFWFVGALMVAKAGAGSTGGAVDVLEQTVPPGYAPPRHLHRHEDEAWYVIEGEATFWSGDRALEATRGAFIFLPRDVEHTFKVGPGGARLLTLAFPSGFAGFVEAAGEPAGERVVPPPGPVDPARLAEIAARYGIEITGPPPAP